MVVFFHRASLRAKTTKANGMLKDHVRVTAEKNLMRANWTLSETQKHVLYISRALKKKKKKKAQRHQRFQEYDGKRGEDKYKRCAGAGHKARIHHDSHTGTSKGIMQGEQRKMTRSLHKKLRGTTKGQKQLQQLIGRGGVRQGLDCDSQRATKGIIQGKAR